jgi:hypothetical protein
MTKKSGVEVSPYTKNNHKKGEPLPAAPDGFWTKDSFRGQLDYHSQRRVLCRDFKLFERRKNSHVGLIGTKYNFYVKEWLFGYPEENGLRANGEIRYVMIYFSFDKLFDMDDVPDETREILAYHLDFFKFQSKIPSVTGYIQPDVFC